MFMFIFGCQCNINKIFRYFPLAPKTQCLCWYMGANVCNNIKKIFRYFPLAPKTQCLCLFMGGNVIISKRYLDIFHWRGKTWKRVICNSLYILFQFAVGVWQGVWQRSVPAQCHELGHCVVTDRSRCWHEQSLRETRLKSIVFQGLWAPRNINKIFVYLPCCHESNILKLIILLDGSSKASFHVISLPESDLSGPGPATVCSRRAKPSLSGIHVFT